MNSSSETKSTTAATELEATSPTSAAPQEEHDPKSLVEFIQRFAVIFAGITGLLAIFGYCFLSGYLAVFGAHFLVSSVSKTSWLEAGWHCMKPTLTLVWTVPILITLKEGPSTLWKWTIWFWWGLIILNALFIYVGVTFGWPDSWGMRWGEAYFLTLDVIIIVALLRPTWFKGLRQTFDVYNLLLVAFVILVGGPKAAESLGRSAGRKVLQGKGGFGTVHKNKAEYSVVFADGTNLLCRASVGTTETLSLEFLKFEEVDSLKPQLYTGKWPRSIF